MLVSCCRLLPREQPPLPRLPAPVPLPPLCSAVVTVLASTLKCHTVSFSVHLSQHRLLKTLSFPHGVVLVPLSCVNWHMCVGLFLGSRSCSVTDLCVCFCTGARLVTAALRLVWTRSTVRPLRPEGCFGYSGYSVVPFRLEDGFFYFCEKMPLTF